jgi:hypothetical protein
MVRAVEQYFAPVTWVNGAPLAPLRSSSWAAWRQPKVESTCYGFSMASERSGSIGGLGALSRLARVLCHGSCGYRTVFRLRGTSLCCRLSERLLSSGRPDALYPPGELHRLQRVCPRVSSRRDFPREISTHVFQAVSRPECDASKPVGKDSTREALADDVR